MSGIFGVTMKRGTDVSASLHALKKWNAMYGTAGSGIAEEDGAALGCCLEHFAADFPCGVPVLRRNGCIAVMDALLYNRDELLPLAELPEDTPDEELLFELVLQKGPDALKKVNGDFAGVIYDPAKREWLCFRDHTGVRPLYIYCKDDAFAFSTDIRGLLSLPGADLAVDERQLYIRLLGGNTNTAQRTDFAHVCMLEAGHYAWISEHDSGWDWNKVKFYVPGGRKLRLPGRRAYEKQLYALVEDAVNRRLRAVPGLIGAELSGGLDSSVINVFINRAGRAAKYLSWSPSLEENPLQTDDERILIGKLCGQENIQCDFLPVDRRSRMELFQQPMPPFVHTTRVGDTAAWMAGQGIHAVFSGHGGDEGASHRMDIYELWYHGEYIAYAAEAYHQLKGRNLRLARVAVRLLRQLKAGKKYAGSWWCRGGNNKEILADTFRKEMEEVILPPLSFGYAPEAFVAAGGQRSRADNAAFQAAEHGVRYLFPLMDHRVMSFALSIPRRMYLKKGKDRLIFRNAFEKLLPPEICWQTRKDSPGMQGLHLKRDGDDYRRSVQHLMRLLDIERWSRYWDQDLLLRLREHAETEDPKLDARSINDLYICWLIQQWQDGGWHDG